MPFLPPNQQRQSTEGQKAYFSQFMFEGSNYFTVSLLSLSWWTERHQLKEAAHRTMQPMPQAT